MSYAERSSNYYDHNDKNPHCWGTSAYDPYDHECRSCLSRESCGRERNRTTRPSYSSGYSVPVNTGYRSSYRREDSGVEVERNGPVVFEGESAITRFFKDSAGGACRGMFYEMYKFWRDYRIP